MKMVSWHTEKILVDRDTKRLYIALCLWPLKECTIYCQGKVAIPGM